MSYLVLARKYRPQTFEDLIGQEHVTRTLSNALREGRVAHAYLFAGPRGVGKTTTARLLARALNCDKGPTTQPCGQCDPCRVIAEGQSLDDVLEIDAASNRGINEIKDICENVRYVPARMKYRITIIDEAHQITKEGFNALLKTLEEPPAHAIFMLATTEPHKVPSTITSRCQRFQFRPLSQDELVAQLSKITKLEKLKVEQDALIHIARAAGGSVRDALSLMDQVATFSTDTASVKDVEEILGLLPQELILEVAQLLKEKNAKGLLNKIREAAEHGHDFPQLVRELQVYFHKLLLSRYGTKLHKLPEAASWPAGEIDKILRHMARLVQELRYSEFPRLSFELFCLKICEPEEAENVKQTPSSQKPPSTEIPSNKEKIEPVKQVKAPEPVPPPLERKTPLKNEAPVKPAPPPDNSPTTHWDPKDQWSDVLENVIRQSVSVGSALGTARIELNGSSLLLLKFSNTFPLERVKRNKDMIEKALLEVYNRSLSMEFTVQANPQAQTGTIQQEEIIATETESAPGDFSEVYEVVEDLNKPSPAMDDPAVKKVLSLFPGRVRSKKE